MAQVFGFATGKVYLYQVREEFKFQFASLYEVVGVDIICCII